ncbi:MAG TPA: hypothetical protein DCM64_03285 [Gammaproteobacteria bacterium]|jgi:predicted DNA-binding protein (MmcQ/YjbR family)|nr:MmcQ/YjbR family DNA-binding protein [Gammaproteobacteria bacterium]MDP6734171.1 MmcQ/YjbR family DNA-binding protein [Gammaproteobacteria bacterium]HAJ75458.1 hypothetical protein [Gammaproteobacteria bacterium]|tara:strand:+ start:740 stop:1507 length:768 start_codon:yes stop_codon:yes gene_type:complete
MNINDAVRLVCLSFPEAEEKESHSMGSFKVRGKTFASYAINHHGDGRVALWLEAPAGSQAWHTQMVPETYFVPPYVGSKGWLGVKLNRNLGWDRIAQRVQEAYEQVAPAELVKAQREMIRIEDTVEDLAAAEIDPLLESQSQIIIEKLTEICESLPETSQARQFGNPVWKAGKKTFFCVHRYDLRLTLQVWVGLEQQSFLVADRRYRVPQYVGHNGWIDLDIEEFADWKEIESLLLNSYRHFALKRMLKRLEGVA